MTMKTIAKLILLSALATVAACGKSAGPDGAASAGSSTEGFFFKQEFNYNLTSNPVVEVPVVRLGTQGDLTVQVTATGASEFTVPGEVVIKDGDRMGTLAVTYDPSKLSFNQLYQVALAIKDYTSLYGFQNATLTIEKPTSYYKYGAGTIVEDWWGEQEDKDMYAREFAEDVLQCYLPDCWGHDSGAGYPVQNYVFYWNTKTNQVYVPFQFMGCEDWCIADPGRHRLHVRRPRPPGGKRRVACLHRQLLQDLPLPAAALRSRQEGFLPVRLRGLQPGGRFGGLRYAGTSGCVHA